MSGSRERVHTGVGAMSGTSLDGIDLCGVRFTTTSGEGWDYEVVKAVTIPYNEEWKEKLTRAPALSGLDLLKLHVEYGHYVGQVIQEFIDDLKVKLKVKVDFAASHGHTIFHQPEDHVTFQLGCGETMASHLACPLVCDFRTKDVALGGQGAPLVPFGEKFLFNEYDFCLNLGGIANISVKQSSIGYDVCPCNMLLNHVTKMVDRKLEFDQDGCLARQGKLDKGMLELWNQLEFYRQKPPRSLGREWFENCLLPSITSYVSRPSFILKSVLLTYAYKIHFEINFKESKV